MANWIDIILAHPEYEVRSKLTAKKYSDWIEGQLRLMPGYDIRVSIDQNNWIVNRMLDKPTRNPKWQKEMYRLARAFTIKQFYEGNKNWQYWTADNFAKVWSGEEDEETSV
jgi:hypothetical protein